MRNKKSPHLQYWQCGLLGDLVLSCYSGGVIASAAFFLASSIDFSAASRVSDADSVALSTVSVAVDLTASTASVVTVFTLSLAESTASEVASEALSVASLAALAAFSDAFFALSAVSDMVFWASSQETITAAEAAQMRIDLNFIIIFGLEVANMIATLSVDVV